MNTIIKAFLLSFFVFVAIIFDFLSIDFTEAEQALLIEETRSQVKQIEKDLLEQEGELQSVDIRERGILGEIEKLEKDISTHRRSLRELSDQTKRVSKKVQEHKRRIQELNRASQTTKEYLKERLVAFYKFGRLGYVGLLAATDSLQEFQRTIKYMKSIMAQDRQMLDMMERQMNQTEKELNMLREDMAKLEVLQEAKSKRMAMVEKTIEKKVFLLMKAHNEKEFYAKAVKELKEAAHALNQTVLHLEQQEKGRFSSESFSKMKGKLPFPLKGEIIRDVEQLGSNPFMHRKGVYIKGSPGEKVRSVFPGKIDYSGWFKGYGQMVIVNHGSHYFTLFAHLEERAGEEGEIVSEGQAIGLAGDPGWDIGPGVYFEIRRGGDNLEPEKWLSTE